MSLADKFTSHFIKVDNPQRDLACKEESAAKRQDMTMMLELKWDGNMVTAKQRQTKPRPA